MIDGKVLLFMGRQVLMPATEKLIDDIRSMPAPRIVPLSRFEGCFDLDAHIHEFRITVDEYAKAIGHAAGFIPEPLEVVTGFDRLRFWRFRDRDEWMELIVAEGE